jgi:pimeloyl-ACP methyl ester carboxylesterase
MVGAPFSQTIGRHPAVATTMPQPVSGQLFELSDKHGGSVAGYAATPVQSAVLADSPLLLVHSVNAAATAFEMKPLFDFYRTRRPVYALDLPGFGLSDRSERTYTPRVMTDAILSMVAEIQARHGVAAIDAMGLSLGCEFVARAANEMRNAFRTVALISPTGLDKRAERTAQKPGQTRAMPWLRSLLNVPWWRHGFFAALTSRASIRYFLQKTWGAKDIDESLLEYDYLTTHQPGAEIAPYYFVSGYLFSTDALSLYRSLSVPVWLAHGVRGDFVDYEQKRTVQRLPNWSVDVFQTGAMPHFEQPQQFVAAYEKFLAKATGT